ncbi:anti-sigma factor antagonist [bacterium]|nr:MAG: anti-sigma factor antagonist [bacterium]
MNNVEIKTDRSESATVVNLVGQALDASNVARFRTETEGLFDDEGKFVIVLKDLKFVDSSGIGALLSCLRRANAAGGDVVLAELPANVRSLFEMVRMNRLFQIFGTKEEALASFE